MQPEILIQRLDPDLPLPGYAKPGDAGADVYCRVATTIAPCERALVPTGIAIALPVGFVAYLVPRSGLALRAGMTMLNSPGVIDAGYRGEIACIVHNADADALLTLSRGERIGQLLIMQMPSVSFVEVDALPGTQRAGDGFGSSGER